MSDHPTPGAGGTYRRTKDGSLELVTPATAEAPFPPQPAETVEQPVEAEPVEQPAEAAPSEPHAADA